MVGSEITVSFQAQISIFIAHKSARTYTKFLRHHSAPKVKNKLKALMDLTEYSLLIVPIMFL